MSEKLAFYNFDKLLSFNATFNFCIGGRGLGKTYGSKRKGIKDAIRTSLEDGDQFIYLRRYKTELQMAKTTFFADIQHEFPDYDFKVDGHNAKAAPVSTRDEKKRQWFIIGYFIPLVIAQNYKSVNFPRVKTIIFDEFIIEKGAVHYLPDEATVFQNFYSTVDRNKDKTRVFFLANSVAIENPYFLFYGIETKDADKNGFIRQFKGVNPENFGFLIVHIIKSEEFAAGVYRTKFGSFIQGTEYADYAVGNTFSDNHDRLIKAKPSTAVYMFTLEGKGGILSIWYDGQSDAYYVQEKRPKVDLMYTLIPNNMDVDRTLMTFIDKPLQTLRSAFRHHRVYFYNPRTRNTFLEIFKR